MKSKEYETAGMAKMTVKDHELTPCHRNNKIIIYKAIISENNMKISRKDLFHMKM